MAKNPPKTQARSRVTTIPAPTPLPDVPAAPSPETASTSGTASDAEPDVIRLSVPVDRKTGKIIESAMRDTTRTRLASALAGSDLSSAPSKTADAAASSAVVVNMLYDLMGSAAVVLARSRGYHASAAEILRYTDEEKAMFSEPTIKVLNKYDLLGGKYADEIGLALVVGGVLASRIMAMNRAQAEIDTAGKAAA